MFANGPQWMNAGWPSSVCTRFGLSASLSRTVIAPAALNCSAGAGSAPPPDRTGPPQLLGGDRLALPRVRDGDRAEPLAQVEEIAGDGRDRHDFRRGGD